MENIFFTFAWPTLLIHRLLHHHELFCTSRHRTRRVQLPFVMRCFRMADETSRGLIYHLVLTVTNLSIRALGGLFMTINRICMGFGLLKTKMVGSLPVGRMGSVISPRPENVPSKYEYSFLCQRFEQRLVVPLQRNLWKKSNHPGDSWQKLNPPYSISNKKNESKFLAGYEAQKNNLPRTKGTALRGLRRHYHSIRVQIAGQRNATVTMDTIEYIKHITPKLSTEYAYKGAINVKFELSYLLSHRLNPKRNICSISAHWFHSLCLKVSSTAVINYLFQNLFKLLWL